MTATRGLQARDTALAPELARAVGAVRPLDLGVLTQARARQDRLTKPQGSLGVLEQIANQVSALTGSCPPVVPGSAVVAVFAADHGVQAQGVSPWPQEVTAQMVLNFVAGGAAVNALARQVGAAVRVVDVGVAAELPEADGLIACKVARGTADFTQGPAMTREQALQALEVGAALAGRLIDEGHDCLLTGDMGIGNTTASAALIAAFTGSEPADVTGRGTGIDEATWQHKVDVIRRGLALHRDTVAGRGLDPVAVLAAVGGLEHAAIAGYVIGAAARRVPVILDGVIAGSAALVAQALAPDCVAACLAGHRSVERGHVVALGALGLRPLVDLDLRLGEGTGAVLALPVVQAAVRALAEMASMDAVGIVDKSAAGLLAEPGPGPE